MKFSIRHLLALTLIVGLSLQALIQWKQFATLKAIYESERNTYRRMESKAFRERTKVCKMVVQNWPYPSEEYLAAKDRFQRQERGHGTAK